MQNVSLAECLTRTIEVLDSGVIRVADRDGGSAGEILLSHGRIGWAACRGQSQTLGAFLWRLGRISREQIVAAQQRFHQGQGRRRLSRVFEESGLMSQVVLRRAILLHTRSAIQQLLALGGGRAEFEAGERPVDEETLFAPEEVLPQVLADGMLSAWTARDRSPVGVEREAWRQEGAHNDVLDPLTDLPGYCAAALISAEGEVLAGHVREGSTSLSMLAVYVAALLEAGDRTVQLTELGAVNCVMLECARGWLAVHWVPDRQHLCFVVLDQLANLSLTRLGFRETMPDLVQFLAGPAEPATGKATGEHWEARTGPFRRVAQPRRARTEPETADEALPGPHQAPLQPISTGTFLGVPAAAPDVADQSSNVFEVSRSRERPPGSDAFTSHRPRRPTPV